MKLRSIATEDYPELLAMIKEMAEFMKMPEKVANSVDIMQQESEYLNGFVIEDEQAKLIGYTTFFYAYYTWIGKSMYLDDLYVRPSFRHRGHGLKLINAVIDKARMENCKIVRWQVSNWNQDAINFYQKLGARLDKVEMNCTFSLM